MIDRLTWRVGFIASAILAALLFVGFATQTIRIEGFNVWPIKHEGFKAANKRLRHDLDEIKKVTKVADQRAREAKARTEAEYRAKAEKADELYEARLASANARADAYARRMRVQDPRRAASGTPASPQDNGAGRAEEADQGTFVAVSRPDFDILTENTERLKAAREWACSLDGAKCE